MRVRRPRYLSLFIALLGLAAGGLAAAIWPGAKGGALPIQRVGYDDFSTAPYESPAPGLAVIASDRSVYEYRLPIAVKAPAIDYGRSMLVIVFNGWRPSSSYGIQVERVRATAENMDILATTVEPRPRPIVAPEATSPYEIIAMPRPVGMRGPVAFRMFPDGSRRVAFEVVKVIE